MNKREKNSLEVAINLILLTTFLATILVVGVTTVRRLDLIANIGDDNEGGEVDESRAEAILERSEEAVSAVELLLSFLEAASVLLVVGLGAAAFYGVRQSNVIRTELREELERVQKARDEIEEFRKKLVADANEAIATVKDTVSDTSTLFLAYQEFVIGNYKESYHFIRRVLDESTGEANKLALYLAGWLEVHHIPDRLDAGIKRLETLVRQEEEYTVVRAVYGVSLRRKALKLGEKHPEFVKLFGRAKVEIERALNDNFFLVDFNKESFWGPLGGILREQEKIDEAIEAYENALKVTPASSYPQGNLSALYLRKLNKDTSWQEKTLQAFRKTKDYARFELSAKPNDYYLLMDIAMSETILQYEDDNKFEQEARAFFQNALEMVLSENVLEVSRRGWNNLYEYCPEHDGKWKSIKTKVKNFLDLMDEAIQNWRNKDVSVKT